MKIDFHTHVFPEKIAAGTLEVLSRASGTPPYTDGTNAGLYASMQKAGIGLCVNLPVMTSPHQVHKVNESLYRARELHNSQGILSFAGIHPDYEDYEQELRLRKEQGFAGIKLHPAYQNCDLDDPRFLRIIDCASSLGMVTLTHAGADIGIPGHNFADVDMILHVIEQVHPERFVLAHMGGWDDWDTVGKYLAGAPVYLDSAFSIGEYKTLTGESVNASPLAANGMSADSFLLLCRKHGTDRILFATDSPWVVQKLYVDAIECMPFTDAEKDAIFEKNARRLLRL